MPDIGQKAKLDLKDARQRKTTKPSGSRAATATLSKAKANRGLMDADEEMDEVGGSEEELEDDEVIQSSLRGKSESAGSKLKFAAAGVMVVIVVVIAFLLFTGKRPNNEPVIDNPDPSPVDINPVSPSQNPPPPSIGDLPGIGTQNFLDNTTMTSSSNLTDPEKFVEDLYGLTTRVDYEVSAIQSASDFVNYTKYRGTWGGGLELYYLDAEYKGNKYVIQVPFKYYKELDETGIIPVKMEILRIKSDSSDGYLTVISYMCLDEETLKAILKTQSK